MLGLAGGQRLNQVRRTPDSISKLCLLLSGDEPELLHHAQIIVALPLLDYLVSFDAVDGDASYLYLPASRRTKLLYLSLVSTAYGVARDDLVTFGYDVLNDCAQVGEGGFVHA